MIKQAAYRDPSLRWQQIRLRGLHALALLGEPAASLTGNGGEFAEQAASRVDRSRSLSDEQCRTRCNARMLCCAGILIGQTAAALEACPRWLGLAPVRCLSADGASAVDDEALREECEASTGRWPSMLTR
jgi:hypothetical protein